MQIEEIKSFIINNRYAIVKISTDSGLTGIGEGTLFTQPEATIAIINRFQSYLLGKNPLQMDHHSRFLYRSSSFRGSAISSALAAIDIALWDIAGKHYNAPIAHLIGGGQTREKVRMCPVIGTDEADIMANKAKQIMKEGFTAIKIDPVPWNVHKMTSSQVIFETIKRISAVRETIGIDIDLAIEIHRKLTPGPAVALAKEIEQFGVLFIEDPIQPDSIDALAEVTKKVHVPIASGERQLSIYEFREMFAKEAVQTIKPDIGLAGGFTSCKKIAALAEAYHVEVSPHNCNSLISTTAHVQYCAGIPNFGILEYVNDTLETDIIKEQLPIENGYIKLPNKPGLGITFNEEYINKASTKPSFNTTLKDDNSVGYL